MRSRSGLSSSSTERCGERELHVGAVPLRWPAEADDLGRAQAAAEGDDRFLPSLDHAAEGVRGMPRGRVDRGVGRGERQVDAARPGFAQRPVAARPLRGVDHDQEQPADFHGVALRQRRVRRAVRQAGHHQGGDREIVGEAAIGELDEPDRRIAVSAHGFHDPAEHPRCAGSGADRGELRGKRLAALGIRPQHDRCEKHRHCHGRGNRLGDAVA